jgi:hypothetical protein
MIRRPNLTSAGLLDHVEVLLRHNGRWRRGPLAHAYLADADGLVTRVGLPALANDEDYAAVGAVLGVEMQDRAAVVTVLQLPADGPVEARETVKLVALGAAGEELERRTVRVSRNRRSGRVVVGDGERRRLDAGE